MLNLPAFDIKMRREGNQTQVWDRLRKRWVALTPEEWVRQHFVNFLIEHRHYPAAWMANEVGIEQNGCQRRCDSIVYDQFAQPLAIVEYKRPAVEISRAVFDQIVRYNMVLHVNVLMVSNGMAHYCCRIAGDHYQFLRDIPDYNELGG